MRFFQFFAIDLQIQQKVIESLLRYASACLLYRFISKEYTLEKKYCCHYITLPVVLLPRIRRVPNYSLVVLSVFGIYHKVLLQVC
jgi:hypothetical protein